jgi:hypothetical protein
MTMSLKSLFFPRLPKPISDASLKEQRAQRIRKIVASVSTGNVSLQQGAFMTDADVERLREKCGGRKLGK